MNKLRLVRIRAVVQFHEDAAVIAAWQRTAGPILAWLTQDRRRTLLAAGAVVVLLWRPADMIQDASGLDVPGNALIPVSVLLALAFVWACFQVSMNFNRLPPVIRYRPQLALHSVMWLLFAGIWLTAGSAGAWHSVLVGLAVILPFLVWRCGYLLLSGQRGRIASTRFRDHLMYAFPAWGGSATPFGKGLDYLSRCEARTETELARSQLAGFKLLLLSALWSVAAALMTRAIYIDATPIGPPRFTLGIPHLEDLIADRSRASAFMSWTSVYCELIQQVFRQAARGHFIIGLLRIFGFNVFRNTYKPLLSESISAYWSRYFYYFKELLSEFFFMPVFARWFRRWNRLRLFAAVMAAACVGNMYYHIIRRDDLIAGDFAGLWEHLHPRVFYCVMLALGIFVSMLREQARAGVAPSAAPHRRIIRIAGVWTFFALIYIWDAKAGVDFWTRMQFFLSLFGLSRA